MKERANEDYVRILHVYIYKHLAYAGIIAALLVPLLIFHDEVQDLYENLTHSQSEWKEFAYDDTELILFEGRVRLMSAKGIAMYEGEFANGKCNGSGTVFDASGRKVYQGMLVDNVMEDSSGTLFYPSGVVSYVGELHENHKNGTGTQYWENGSVQYSGMFVNDVFEGEGRAYDRDGNIIYEGQFVNGEYHGSGILYEEGNSIQKVYEGDFAFGAPNGTGILYDTFGKAYYEGPVKDGFIHYTAFLPGSLQDIADHFLYPYQIYVYQKHMAVAFPKNQLIFVLHQELPLLKEDKEWKLSDQIKPKEVMISQILLVHDDVHEPGSSLLRSDVQKAWQSVSTDMPYETRMTPADVFALSVAADQKLLGHVEKIDHQHDIYELKPASYLMAEDVLCFPLDRAQFVYRWFSSSPQALYTLMEEKADRGVMK